MKIASVVIFIFIVLVSGLSVYLSTEKNIYQYAVDPTGDLLVDLERLRTLSVQASSDTVGDTEREFISKQYETLIQEVSSLKSREYSQNLANTKNTWIKLGFSIVFGLAALFVVLSQKYNRETQKWAFSTLSLLAGVWIGTMST